MPRTKTIPQKSSPAFTAVSEPIKKKSRKSKLLETHGIRLQVKIAESDYPYRLGSVVITLQDSKDFANIDCFIVESKPESSECCLCWKDSSDIQENTLPAVCETPYNVLQSLDSLKIFHFVIHSHKLHIGDNIIQVYLDPSTFIALNTASAPYFNHHRKKVYDLLQFFLKIEFEEYEENYLYDEEQVEKTYGCISNCYDPELSDIVISHDSLIPSLRKYQSQAVHWMLKRENSLNKPEADLHELYTVLTLQDGQELYFHKYGGYFVNCKYAPEEPCKGGILADEMGLGKTLEVLACILLNPRNCSEIQNKAYSNRTTNGLPVNNNKIIKCNRKRKLSDDDKEFEEHNELQNYEDNDHFECACGSEDYLYSSMPIVNCGTCGILQHAECIFYKPELISEDDYTCPYCLISSSNLQSSRATLIISPASIIYQWEEEILRHVKKNHLKVFMYEGVEHQNFVDPSYLADHDIVLVSYETLKKELNHVDVPHGTSGLSLRHRKKFISIPSPMCAIQWWRICLDEAQMVESVSSKIAKMAGKLYTIHRWCVTGTPIKKSIEDLYGLLVFLEMKPFHEKVWWKEVLWKPFVNGNTSPLSSVLKHIAWRTTKQQVLDQIGLPGLEKVVHKLDFTPIERVFYEKQHSHCRGDFIEKINKFDALDVKLRYMDKHVLSKVMLPLRRLQLVCCHFQINQGSVDVQKKKITTTELLTHLLKTTKYECEDAHRKLIMAMSGVAGIYLIRNDIQNAVETYEKTLKSIEDNKTNLRTDKTQLIHSLFQLSNILSMSKKSGKNVESKLSLPELNAKIEELSTEYVEKYKLSVEACRKNIDDVSNEIIHIIRKFKLKRPEFPTSAWFSTLFENVEEEQKQSILRRIEVLLNEAQGKGVLKKESALAKSISTISFYGLLSKLMEMSKSLYDTRSKLRSKIESISAKPSISTMNSAISCHLRPEKNSVNRCQYCKVDDIFNEYAAKLFRFDEVSYKPEEEENEEKSICFQTARRGNHGESDLELVLKFLLHYGRRIKGLPECIEDGVNEFKLLEALKKEFKFLRNYWLKCVEYVQQKDEVEMAKITTRVLLPGETPPNPPVPYILLPHEVQSKMVQHHSDIIAYQFELKKKMGQLYYLQNLKKAENNDSPFDEYCPICQQTFEKSWSVLQCGHSFCLVCIQKLLSCKTKFTNNLGFVCHGIRCPVCRQFTAASDVYFIDNSKEEPMEEQVTIKGSYSTKTTGVVKCLLEISKSDPGAKSLVFSNFTDFLYILEDALLANNVKCLNFCKRKHFQEQLQKFKQSEDCNVLLIPLTFGCSGLNITEATNVLLIEPILDKSKHLQAIGRIHRIGQTKKATVHRFLVSKTVEENIYDVIENSSTKDDSLHSELTLQNLVDE